MPPPKHCQYIFEVMTTVQKQSNSQSAQHMLVTTQHHSQHKQKNVLTKKWVKRMKDEPWKTRTFLWDLWDSGLTLLTFPLNMVPRFKGCPSFPGKPSITWPATETTCFLYSSPPSVLFCWVEQHAPKSMCGVLLLEYHPLIGQFPERSVRILYLDWLNQVLNIPRKTRERFKKKN